MHRFLVSFPLRDTLTLSEGDLFHQISRVFRSKKGDTMVFFTSAGMDMVYEIIDVNKREITFKKISEIRKSHNNKLDFHIFQAYPNKISTIELIVQKLVEIGVKKITFFPGEHSQMQSFPLQKEQRIVTIAREALEQSGGNEMPLISYSHDSLQDIIPGIPHVRHIVGHQEGERLSISGHCGPLALWIGPEGGWSASETEFFKTTALDLWSFNNNILRLETATIVGTGLLFYMQGAV